MFYHLKLLQFFQEDHRSLMQHYPSLQCEIHNCYSFKLGPFLPLRKAKFFGGYLLLDSFSRTCVCSKRFKEYILAWATASSSDTPLSTSSWNARSSKASNLVKTTTTGTGYAQCISLEDVGVLLSIYHCKCHNQRKISAQPQ